MVGRLELALVVATGCGRIGFEALGGDAGMDAMSTGVFTPFTLPDGAGVSRIRLAPDGSVYAILGASRVVRSATGTAPWTSCAAVTTDELGALAFDPSNKAIYLAGYADVWRSTDACATWTSTGFGQAADAVGVLNGRVYAGAYDGLHVLASSTWSHVATSMDGGWVYDIEVNAAQNSVYLAGDNEFAVSVDGGMTWAANLAGLNGSTKFLALDPSNPQHLLIGGGATNNLSLSNNGGMSWSAVEQSGYGAAFDPADPLFVAYAVYNYGISRSLDGGTSFELVDHRSPEMDKAPVLDMAFSPAGMYAATGRGVFFTPDHFATWQELDAGLNGWSITRVVTTTDGTIYLGTLAGVLVSTDHGATWSGVVINNGWNEQIASMTAVPGSASSVIVGAVNQVLRTDDHGQSYSLIYAPGPIDNYVVADVQLSGTRMVIATDTGVETADAPFTTFTHRQLAGAAHTVQTLLSLDSVGSKFVAGTIDGAFYSTDGATTFVDISTGLVDRNLIALVALPDGSLLAATDSSGVWRSGGPGQTWVASGLAGHGLYGLFATGGRVFAAIDQGVFASADNGLTWTLVPGLDHLAPVSFAVGPDANLLVGTAASGLFQTPLP